MIIAIIVIIVLAYLLINTWWGFVLYEPDNIVDLIALAIVSPLYLLIPKWIYCKRKHITSEQYEMLDFFGLLDK